MTGPQPLTRQRSTWRPAAVADRDGYQFRVRNVGDGRLVAVVATPDSVELEWHMSISHNRPDGSKLAPRYPTWDEISAARYELLPNDITVAMLLPPPDEYVAVHPTTFHLHEIDR